MDQDNYEKSNTTHWWQNLFFQVALLLAILGGVVVITAFIFGSTGPEPDFVNARILIPGPTDNRANITLSNNTNASRFTMNNLCENCQFPLFRLISEHSRGPVYCKYTLLNTGDQYITEVGWFNTTGHLRNTEKDLLNDLIVNGNVSQTTLDLQPEFLESGRLSITQNYPNISTQYTVTQYTSNITSGYFLVLENSQQGYAIVYFGTPGPSDLLVQSPHLKVLIFQTIDQSVINFDVIYKQEAGIWKVHGLEPFP
jgi:hypothetical protein